MDHRTRAGREAIDKAVTKALKRRNMPRGDIATAIGVDATIVSASLKRLVARGVACVAGERGQARYSRVIN